MPSFFASSQPSPVAIGTGRLTLDVIIRSGSVPAEPRSQAGGTCGNVLANLAYLGWSAWPLTDLGDDDSGQRFSADLARFGVHLDLIASQPGEETPVIIHHIKYAEGQATHHFSSRCPFCARKLRYYEPIPEQRVLDRLDRTPKANVCFFDRDSPGAFALARHAAASGALVVFEPNYAGKEVNLLEALQIAHVLKISKERLPDLAEQLPHRPLLIVETLAAEGLRFRDCRFGIGEWVHLPAMPAPVVRDAGGSGDWCTAGLIHRLGQGGLAGFLQARQDELVQGLRFGQALGTWNCAFEGARGGVYAVGREKFARDVSAILAGEVFDPADGSEPATHDIAGRFCPGCGGQAESR